MHVHGVAELPRRPTELVEVRQRALPVHEPQQQGDDLGEVVADRRAARHVDHRQSEAAAVVPAQEVLQAHRAGRVPQRTRDPAPRRARPDRDGDRRLRGEDAHPLGGRPAPPLLPRCPQRQRRADRGPRLGPHRQVLVGDGALVDDDVRRIQATLLGLLEQVHEVVARLHLELVVVQHHHRHAGQRSRQQLLQAGLGRAERRDAAAVAAHPGKPEHVDLLERPERVPAAAGLQQTLVQLVVVRAGDVADLIGQRAAPLPLQRRIHPRVQRDRDHVLHGCSLAARSADVGQAV